MNSESQNEPAERRGPKLSAQQKTEIERSQSLAYYFNGGGGYLPYLDFELFLRTHQRER